MKSTLSAITISGSTCCHQCANKEIVQGRRNIMGKRTLIITSETQTILNGENEEKYTKYAKEHNLEINGKFLQQHKE